MILFNITTEFITKQIYIKMKNAILSILKISALLVAAIILSSITSTLIIYILSYAVDFPIYDNIYLTVILNAMFIGLYAYIVIKNYKY